MRNGLRSGGGGGRQPPLQREGQQRSGRCWDEGRDKLGGGGQILKGSENKLKYSLAAKYSGAGGVGGSRTRSASKKAGSRS